ncbi:cytoplasmic polyadenylation element-binding protein 1-like isoform X3 [Trichomycterus rosablanca]|uniref:cytoplasmic polyadenylation element-binding protein 1-like isoform X3 n=1 Tax=Trichomycterus rosablanca TaxID=2290929 RepID=UPI002F34F45C
MDPDTAQDVSTGPQSPELVVQGTQTSDLGHNLGVHLPGYPDPEHNPGGGLQRYPDSHCVHGAPQSIRTITWRGQLPPPRNPTHPKVYSRKVFLGGIPHNITEGALLEEFGGCGPVKVEWPHRSRGGHVRRGNGVGGCTGGGCTGGGWALLQTCTQDHHPDGIITYHTVLSTTRHPNQRV